MEQSLKYYTQYMGLPNTNMPPEAPAPTCCQLTSSQIGSSPITQLPTAVTSSFIRTKGIPTYFDNPLPDSVVNNPAPIPVYVRLKDGRFYLNDRPSPRLVLQRGGKYQFNIVTGCCPFYFSSKPGGQPDIFGIPPTEYDLRTYVITHKLPARFYYTSVSGKSADLVGEVIVV